MFENKEIKLLISKNISIVLLQLYSKVFLGIKKLITKNIIIFFINFWAVNIVFFYSYTVK